MKILRILSVMVVLTGFLAGSGFCSGLSDDAAEYLVKFGIKELERGRLDDALHEFSKALMLEPDNPKAKMYLERYGLKEGLYSGVTTHTTKIAGLARKNELLQNRLKEMALNKAESDRRFAKIQAHRDNMSRELTDRNLETYQLRDEVAMYKHFLEVKDEIFWDQVSQVEDIYQDIAQQQQTADVREAREWGMPVEELGMVHAYENELLALQQLHNKLREAAFQRQLSADYTDAILADYVLIRSKVMDDLGDELLYKEMDIVRKEGHVNDKIDEIVDLTNLIREYRERMEEREELIQEKERDIEYLKQRLSIGVDG